MPTSAAPQAFRALALQVPCRAVNACRDVAEARQKIRANIAYVDARIRASKTFVGSDLKLVVLPEYFATGFPIDDAIPAWTAKAAFAPDGAECAALAGIAQRHGVYLSSNHYESDSNFPQLYFQACVVFSDSGAVVLRYRRLISLYTPTPHDVWDGYLERYGADAVLPVAITPLGRLACIASEEILYPELARALALKGAEIFLHSTSEAGSPQLTRKDIAKRARAAENLAWVVSANSAGILDTDFPAQSTDGYSKIVDDGGRVLAEAGPGESMVAHADIDLPALRRRRLRPGMDHTLSRLPAEPFRELLSRPVRTANTLLEPGGRVRVPERAEFVQRQREAIERLRAAGILGDG